MSTPAGCYGATSGPVTVTMHGSGDIVLPLVTIGDVPVSGADLEARIRACLDVLDMRAADD